VLRLSCLSGGVCPSLGLPGDSSVRSLFSGSTDLDLLLDLETESLFLLGSFPLSGPLLRDRDRLTLRLRLGEEYDRDEECEDLDRLL